MKRARDLGVVIGSGRPGRWNAITDVEGVRVGHETIVEGLEAMPDAFRGLFSGQNVGKMLVRL